MARIDTATRAEWLNLISAWLAERNLTTDAIQTGADAWSVWTRAVNNPLNVYRAMPDVVDAHIQTALQSMFPSVTFKDAKRY